MSRSAPKIWLLIGDKLGDNHQVELIARHLTARFGWQIDIRQLRFGASFKTGKPRFRASVDHVDLAASDPLTPPWPDVLITIGRRPSMAALWIKQRSGGRTRLVIVGRPRRWLNRFDLIVAPAHHHVPPLPNVVRLGLPLIVTDPAALATARNQWQAQMAQMRRPLFAVFVGGPTKPHVFDAAVARELMQRAVGSAAAEGGSLWVATSPRTSAEVVDALAAALPADGRLFRWSAGQADNPFLGLLACADRFMVTGDSVSMQVEVARLGKPLAIFALPVHYGPVEYLRRRAARYAYGKNGSRPLARLIRALQGLGVVQFPRDVAEIHQLLFERGMAVALGQPFLLDGTGVDVDLANVVERIGALAGGQTLVSGGADPEVNCGPPMDDVSR